MDQNYYMKYFEEKKNYEIFVYLITVSASTKFFDISHKLHFKQLEEQ